ncbi:apolipoprotein L6-like isoform X2 [Ctenopharyngodon idella]|uniref:apolipoprotein L6-like isoform X2 n=1 Tax=Ctenopharyngodon idella TaxID=7959 RepID=UPI002232AAA2|nr:apolipoprotein L6-like isoform X2 [Ctenopharyngodon idella]
MANPSARPIPAMRKVHCIPGSRKLVGMNESPQGEVRHPLAAGPPSNYQNCYSADPVTELKIQTNISVMTAPPEHQDCGSQDKKSACKGNNLKGSTDQSGFSDSRAGESFEKTLKRYVCHLPFCASSMQRQISELHEVADSLDKTHKGTRIAKITGGTTGALGAAAVVGGILLAPATMGASLAVAAVGVGVTAAGGVTGASAAITKKVKTNQVRKKVESILKEYQKEMNDIEGHLNDINTEMEKLKGVNVKSAKTVRLVEIASGTSGALSVMNRSSGVIQGFALGMDFFFNEKDSQKLKKESKTRFAEQIREVADQIQAGLTELLDMRNKLLLEGI